MPNPIDAIVEILKRGRFDYADEKICQSQIENHLLQCGVEFIREYVFANGIADFFFPNSGLVLEIKGSSQWSKTRVFRQCERYCENKEVTGLVLATGKAQGLPGSINGKPVRIYQLGISNL